MTIETTTNLIRYQGDGAATTFTYSFLIPTEADSVITYTDASGNETVLVPGQYTISGLNNPAGGSVTYPLSGSPIAVGTFLSIARELPIVQETDFTNQDGFYPETLESALDYLTMLVQQVSTLDSQSIRVPATEDAPPALPAAATRANQTLIFDSNGDPTVGGTTTATVSAAMQPVVAASTLLSARTLMGVAYLPSSVSTNQTVALADIGTRYMTTGARTFTMPDSTQVPAGFSFSVYALTADCILDPVATDTIYGYSMGASATVSAGTVAEVVTDGAGNWWSIATVAAEDYVGMLRPFAGFEAPNAKYVFADGASYLRSTFPACFAAITMRVTVTKVSGTPVLGGFTVGQAGKLAAGMLVEGDGIPAGATILTTPGAADTSITLDVNATNSTTVQATIIPHGAVDSTHFNVPDTQDRVIAGADTAQSSSGRLSPSYFGASPRVGRAGGVESHQLVELELATVTPAGTNSKPAITITGGTKGGTGILTAIPGGGGGSAPSTPTDIAAALDNAPVFTGTPFGGDTPHPNVQPTIVCPYLIRVLP